MVASASFLFFKYWFVWIAAGFWSTHFVCDFVRSLLTATRCSLLVFFLPRVLVWEGFVQLIRSCYSRQLEKIPFVKVPGLLQYWTGSATICCHWVTVIALVNIYSNITDEPHDQIVEMLQPWMCSAPTVVFSRRFNRIWIKIKRQMWWDLGRSGSYLKTKNQAEGAIWPWSKSTYN